MAVGVGGRGAVQHHGGHHRNGRMAGAHLFERAATHGDDGASFLALERGGQIPRAGGSLEIHHAESRPSEDGSDAGERFRINLHARFADHHDTGGIGRLGGGEDPRSQQEGYSHARHTSLTKADPPSPGRRSTLRKMGSA